MCSTTGPTNSSARAWTCCCPRRNGCGERLASVYPVPLERIQQQRLLSRIWQGEVQHMRRDGTKVSVATHWALLTDGENEPLSVIETQTDVTARSQMQEELEAANKR